MRINHCTSWPDQVILAFLQVIIYKKVNEND